MTGIYNIEEAEYKDNNSVQGQGLIMLKGSRKQKREKCESVKVFKVSLTIRQGAEDGCRAEAAITSHGAHPHLHLILSGPAEVRQHGLVSVTLRVVALILTAPLLEEKGESYADWR